MADHRSRDHSRRIRRRVLAIKRLGLLIDYDGPVTDRGMPTALGEFILNRWRADDSADAHEKVERLLHAVGAAPEVAERELASYLERLDVEYQGLTASERKTLYLLSLGFQTKHIATLEGVTVQTVKERLRSSYRKLGVHNATQAVAYCIRRGWLWH